MSDYYEFKVKKQEFIPNRKNPKKIKIIVETEICGEKFEQNFPFTPDQVNDGRWEKHVVKWIERKECKVDEEKEDIEIPDLEGERIKNSGRDFTGPEREYPGQDRK